MSKNKIILILILLYVFSCGYTASAQPRGSIYPEPKKIEYKDGFVSIDSSWQIINEAGEEYITIVEKLSQDIKTQYDLYIPIGYNYKASYKKIIVCHSKSNIAKSILQEEELSSKDIFGEEAYAIITKEDTIYIVSNDPLGAFYGCISFASLLRKQNGNLLCPLINIVDYPTYPVRAVHFCAADPKLIKGKLEEIAMLKYNTAIIDTWDYFHLEESNNADKWKDIYDYARSLHINPIPELQSFGAAGSILIINPQSAEGIWIKNAEFKFFNNIAKPVNVDISMQNILRNKETDIVVTSVDKKTLYEEGRDYEIIGGFTAYPFDEGNKPYIIKRIENGRLKNGQSVLVSYDYVERKCDFASWSIPYCPSSEMPYQIMDSAIKDVIKYLKPSHISIGHDEIRGLNRDSRCLKRNMTNAELLSEDINKLYDIIKKYDNSIDILMWADMLNPWHNGGDKNYQLQFGGIPGKTDIAIDHIPNDIILILWWENSTNIKKSTEYFSKKDFNYWTNGTKWIRKADQYKHFKGIIITNWENWQKGQANIKEKAVYLW